MPPPAKKRKTAAGSVPADTRRTTRSQRPRLSIEMIAKVASFAQYGGDLMNICKAVGRKESAVVRYTCLRNNLGYLEHCLRNLVVGRMKSKIACWMEVNTDWRRLCTKDRTEDDELSTGRYENEEGMLIRRTDPLIIFNNPAVAIDFGIIDVLRHLVEEVGIDINACKWVGYRSRFGEPCHILSLAYSVLTSSRDVFKSICFEYVVSRADLDVCASILRGEDNSNQVWHGLLYHGSNLASFEAVVQHRSFDPNRGCDMGGVTTLPLHKAISCILDTSQESRSASVGVRKVDILLKAGADPKRATNDFPSPLDYAKFRIRRVGEQSEQGKLSKILIRLMEKYSN